MEINKSLNKIIISTRILFFASFFISSAAYSYTNTLEEQLLSCENAAANGTFCGSRDCFCVNEPYETPATSGAEGVIRLMYRRGDGLISQILGTGYGPKYTLAVPVINSILNRMDDQNLGEGSCPTNVGNPVNAATGNKYHKENILIASGPNPLVFEQYYNSHANQKWRHGFSQKITLLNATPGPTYATLSGYALSSMVLYPSSACVSGWDEVKANYAEAWAASATATYTADGRCQINHNGVVRETLNLYKDGGENFDSYRLNNPLSLPQLEVTRPDGRLIKFYKKSGIWVNENGIVDELVELADANSVTTGWNYRPSINITENYDASGRLTSIVDRLGSSKAFSYDALNNLVGINNSTGEYLNFSYDASGRISAMTDHINRSWGFRYDVNGTLEYIDNPDGTAR